MIIPVTLFLIIFILYLAFRRMADVTLTLISLPLALSGGLWLLYLLDFHLSIAVAVGFIALSGIAVELAVVMILFLNTALQAVQNDKTSLNHSDIRGAITEGALMRLRPLRMTVITIFAGLLPIMIGTGTGSEVMQRIAAPMVGGMASATLLTLVVIPAAFYLWHRRGLNTM